MKQSPIQLLQLTFRKVLVEIDPQHAPNEPPNPMTSVFIFDGVNIATEVTLGELDMAHDRGPIYLVTLRVLIDNQAQPEAPDAQFSPYLIDVSAAGVILLPKGAEALGPAADLVSVNGASLLWSAIREQVLALSSRMPAGPVMLPTVHFHDLKQGDASQAEHEAAARKAIAEEEHALVKAKRTTAKARKV